MLYSRHSPTLLLIASLACLFFASRLPPVAADHCYRNGYYYEDCNHASTGAVLASWAIALIVIGSILCCCCVVCAGMRSMQYGPFSGQPYSGYSNRYYGWGGRNRAVVV